MQEDHTEVLVIGAGPTGLFVAGELARHGVQPRIIDQAPAAHQQTRATELQPAALEALQRAGLVDKFLAVGLPMKGLRIVDAELEEAFSFSIPPADSPFPHTLSLPQWQTEEILHEGLRAQGVRVERGVTVREIIILEQGVQVLCSPEQGEDFVIAADYVIGTGGAHSPLRHAMGEHLDGITYPHQYLVADVRTEGIDRGNQLITVAIAPTGLVMVIELPDGRALVLSDLPEGREMTQIPGLAETQATIAHHLPKPFVVEDLRWASVYRMHRRMSPKFAQGRCLLAGDAAHLCSPMGGEGMNAGLLDAASLAWMLGAVLRRGGKRALLEAYAMERQEMARQVLASSDAMHEYYAKLVAMSSAGLPLAQPADDPTVRVTSGSMLDLSISESPILGFHGSTLGLRKLKPGQRFPKAAALSGERHHLLVYPSSSDLNWSALATRWAHVLEIHPGGPICPAEVCGIENGLVLVRPDGWVGFLSADWTDEALQVLDRFLSLQFDPAI